MNTPEIIYSISSFTGIHAYKIYQHRVWDWRLSDNTVIMEVRAIPISEREKHEKSGILVKLNTYDIRIQIVRTLTYVSFPISSLKDTKKTIVAKLVRML